MELFTSFLFSLLLTIFLLFIHKLLSNSTKNLPPSPPSLPIIGHLHILKKPLHGTLQTLSACYGPILYLRFGFAPVLVISSPSAVEECFCKKDIIFANRPPFIAGKHLGYNYTAFGWAPYGHHWRNLRLVSTIEVFSSKSLQNSAGIRKEEIESLIKQLLRRSKNGGGFVKVDMRSMFMELVLNVMMKIIAGKRCFEDDEEMGMEEKRRLLEYLRELFVPKMALNLGDLFPILKWLGNFGVVKRLVDLRRRRDVFLQALIEEQRKKEKGENKEKSLIGSLLRLQEAEPEPYPDDIVKGLFEVLVLILL